MVIVDERKVLRGPKDSKDVPLQSIGQLLFNEIKKAPQDEIALISESFSYNISYGELLEKSIKVAIYFKKVGLKRGDTISIVNENSTNFVVLLLAAFYQGVTVNCLSPSYTAGELERLLEQSKPTLIFCSEHVGSSVKYMTKIFSFLQEIIILDDDPKNNNFEKRFCDIDVEISNFKPVNQNCEEIALILTSSGTTGFPKSVLLPHSCLRFTLIFMSDKHFGHMSSDDVMLMVLPLTHVLGLMVVTSALYNASTSVLISKFKPERYLNAIEKYRGTTLYVVPTLMNFLAKSPLLKNYNLDSVRDVVSAGAPLSSNVLVAVKNRFKQAIVRQIYGLTELGSAALMQPWSKCLNQFSPFSVGTVLHDLQIIIRDKDNGTQLGHNEVGELLIKGPISMKGYIDNEKETSEAFDSDGFLRTGDAAYYDENGFFYIIDRYKELIKYKGFQVSPAEIEAVLLKNPDVKECAVLPKPDERAGEVPIAFVVKLQPNLTEEELIREVAENLSINKRLYGGVVFVPELPKNNFGKVLRASLKIQAAQLV